MEKSTDSAHRHCGGTTLSLTGSHFEEVDGKVALPWQVTDLWGQLLIGTIMTVLCKTLT